MRRALLMPYHFAWALCAALWYGRPAKQLTLIGVTGTKGKSTVAEMLHAIFTEAGHTTALASTIRFAVGSESRPNLYKMTLPGRGFIQTFLAGAVAKGATHAVVEITSEAALQWRHAFLDLDALVFTNLQKEHIESHGSFENYFRAKYRIGRSLERSPKRPRAIIANADDDKGAAFLALAVEKRIAVRLADATHVTLADTGASFTYGGVAFTLHQPGTFSVVNALLATQAAEAFGIGPDVSARALAKLERVAGRAERIDAGQDFIAVVDYAHTPDSLAAFYGAYPHQRKICVLGNTGGGRDTWKRPLMGKIAAEQCDQVILTNEDPYDEDPRAIVEAMVKGMLRAPEIIMDRRLAIRRALQVALSWSKGEIPRQARDNQDGIAVLVTGKGTDPFIMGAGGAKEPWSDAAVVREELEQLVSSKHE